MCRDTVSEVFFMRVAIVHYWLLNMRGGEKVVEALCRLFPDADIFTLFYDPASVSATIREHQVYTSFLQPARRYYRSLLPLMPIALESLDLRGYDLVISSESGPAKGVILSSATRHVCYCHTPMRYLWELSHAYRNDWTRSAVKRCLMAPLGTYLRMWDYASAARVDEFVANSRNVAQRIWSTYRRDSVVAYPPVAVQSFYNKTPQNYYLAVSELIPYKRIDQAIRVCARTGRRLRIVGEGPEYKNLRRLANSNIEFCGRVPDDSLRELYAGCRGFLMPGEEDFGMAAVEALASGKPVVALARGGALETVSPSNPFTGVLYQNPSDAGLEEGLTRLERSFAEVDSPALQSYAQRFSEAEFNRRMRTVLFGRRQVGACGGGSA
jgi:glycosyltransferase involved in cell wall biosynthesis